MLLDQTRQFLSLVLRLLKLAEDDNWRPADAGNRRWLSHSWDTRFVFTVFLPALKLSTCDLGPGVSRSTWGQKVRGFLCVCVSEWKAEVQQFTSEPLHYFSPSKAFIVIFWFSDCFFWEERQHGHHVRHSDVLCFPLSFFVVLQQVSHSDSRQYRCAVSFTLLQ